MIISIDEHKYSPSRCISDALFYPHACPMYPTDYAMPRP